MTVGIGLALVEAFLARPNTIVIAAVRDTTAPSLRDIKPAGEGSKLLVRKLDSALETDPAELVQDLVSNVPHIDIIIANAAVSHYQPVMETTSESMRETYEVNVLGPLRLFQATWPSLLSKSALPRFFVISSLQGSIQEATDVPYFAYGASKAAVNLLARKVHLEHPTCVSVTIHPGYVDCLMSRSPLRFFWHLLTNPFTSRWVRTDMGQAFADSIGVAQPPMTLKECQEALVAIVRKAHLRRVQSNS